MGKLKLSSEEREQILESHNKYRDILMGHLFDTTLVSEQATPNMPAKQLFALAKQNCAKDGPIASAQPGTHLGKDVLVYKPTAAKEGVWDQGDDVYFYADGTYIVVGRENRVKGTRLWNCPNLQFERDRANNLINTLTKDYKYFLYDTLPKGYQVPAQEKDQTVLDIIQVGNTLLYRPKAATMQPGATTDKESEIIDTYLTSFGIEKTETGRGPWKYENEMTEQERQTWWSGRIMIPKSAGLSKNIVIYLDPSRIDRKQLLKITRGQQKEVEQRYNEKYCGRVIMAYYDAWRKGVEYDFGTLEGMKKEVNACLRQNHNYGTLGIGGKNIDKAILALREKYTGDSNFPTLPKSGRDVNRPVVRQLTTPTGEVEYQFDFRINR
jgi:hypothetical protein